MLQLSPRENEVFYDVVAIVDPLTREAQKMSALLIVSCVLVSICSVSKRRAHKYKANCVIRHELPVCCGVRLSVSMNIDICVPETIWWYEEIRGCPLSGELFDAFEPQNA